MSQEEDVELRDLVIQNLERNGTLAKLRAQLRASVFLAIEDNEKIKDKPVLLNQKAEKYQQTERGKLCCSLVADFLSVLQLKASESVFRPEINAQAFHSRKDLAKQLGINTEPTNDVPLLEYLLPKVKNGLNNPFAQTNNINSEGSKDSRQNASVLSDGFRPITNTIDDDFFGKPPDSPADKYLISSTVTQRTKLGTLKAAETGSNTFPQNDTAGNSTFASKFDSLFFNKSDSFQENLSNGKKPLLGDLPDLNTRSTVPSSSSTSALPMLDKKKGHEKEINLKSLIGDSDEDSSRSARSSDKSAKTKSKATIGPSNALAGNKESGLFVTKIDPTLVNKKQRKSSDADDDISEEIVEDLEVDDLLSSTRSPHQISF